MKEKKRILIVDDDKDLSMLICDMVEDHGYIPIHVAGIEDAFEQMTERMPHLIILDINLPDGTGFELCEELRKRSQVPIIFASARTSEDDKVNGLDMGGDDYLAKPYSLKEMMSRINSLIRRTYGMELENDVQFLETKAGKKIEIDTAARSVKCNGKAVELAPKEYDLFLYLMEHKGKVISKETLLNEVWGPYSEVEQSTLTVHIRWLREKFEDNPSKPEWIKTVWGVGYMMTIEEMME